MMRDMDNTDWTRGEYLGNIAADELSTALHAHGITAVHVGSDGGEVSINFLDLVDATAFLTMAVDYAPTPGTLYDRVTSGCVTFTDATRRGLDMAEDDVRDVLDRGWDWSVHPDMKGCVVRWHVSVDLPVADACQVTARLNELRNGVAL